MQIAALRLFGNELVQRQSHMPGPCGAGWAESYESVAVAGGRHAAKQTRDIVSDIWSLLLSCEHETTDRFQEQAG